MYVNNLQVGTVINRASLVAQTLAVKPETTRCGHRHTGLAHLIIFPPSYGMLTGLAYAT